MKIVGIARVLCLALKKNKNAAQDRMQRSREPWPSGA